MNELVFGRIFGDGATSASPRAPSVPLEDVIAGTADGDVESLFLRSHDSFVAGCARNVEAWREISHFSEYGSEMMSWIEHGIDAGDFWASDARPSHYVAPNRKVDPAFVPFLDEQLEKDLRSGAARCLGPCSSTDAPLMVYAIGIEPTKPRRVGDLRPFNEFTVAPKHSPEQLRDVTAWVGELLAVMDISTAYYNFAIKPSSWKYFGFRQKYKGVWHWFVSTVGVFGWNVMAFVLHTCTTAIVRRFRAYSIVNQAFYDDFALGPLSRGVGDEVRRTKNSVYIFCCWMEKLGLFVAKKSRAEPSSEPRFLGIILLLKERRYQIPEDKRGVFLDLLSSLVEGSSVLFASLERFVGKCAYLSMVLQGGMAFTRQQYLALAAVKRGSRVPVTSALRAELLEWGHIDPQDREPWLGAPWLSPSHAVVTLKGDGSDHRVGAFLENLDLRAGSEVPEELLPSRGVSINVRELYSFLFALLAFGEHLRDKWLDLHMDSTTALAWLNNGASPVPLANAFLIEIWRELRRLNCHFAARSYINTKLNVESDDITREDPRNDYRVADAAFEALAGEFGPFHVDAMASAVNAKCARFFSRYHCPGSAGVNILAQKYHAGEVWWVFPPFALVAPVVAFLLAENATFGIVVQHKWESWWNSLNERATVARRIGVAGSADTVRGYSSKSVRGIPNALDMWFFFIQSN